MNNLQLKTIKITDLKPHPKNPRIHPDSAINKLVASIQEYGWTNPLLISEDGYILAGHARLKAAEKAGLKEVPCIVLPLSGTKALAYLIADNRLQQETAWDVYKLQSLVSSLSEDINFNFDITGFDHFEIERIAAELSEETKQIFDEKEKYPEMALRAFEHYDYVVAVFRNSMDFLKVCELLGIERVKASYKKGAIGLGRVIEGIDLLNKLKK